MGGADRTFACKSQDASGRIGIFTVIFVNHKNAKKHILKMSYMEDSVMDPDIP